MAEHFHMCETCRGAIKNERAASWFPPGSRQPVLFCSFGCRRRYINDRPTPPRALPGANAARGVISSGKPPRKKTPSEIRKAMRPLESAISTAIGNTFEANRVWNTRVQTGAVKTASGHLMKLARKGTPDRIAAAGLIVFVEVKRQGEKPSAEQVQTIETLKRSGSLAFVLDDPADCDFIINGLARLPNAIDKINKLIAEIQAEIDAEIAAGRAARTNGKLKR